VLWIRTWHDVCREREREREREVTRELHISRARNIQQIILSPREIVIQNLRKLYGINFIIPQDTIVPVYYCTGLPNLLFHPNQKPYLCLCTKKETDNSWIVGGFDIKTVKAVNRSIYTFCLNDLTLNAFCVIGTV
jgi:hypothetical protein